MEIKRYHEAPKSIFKEVQKYTDGDYALVHLFETDREYYNMFAKAVADGRDVILDNSLFELREQFDPDRYAYWINKLKPTWYIVPDVWKDSQKTIDSFREFVAKYPKLPGKRIGVAQGMGLKDTIECYKAIEPYCDMVAFNLHGEQWYKEAIDPTCKPLSMSSYEFIRAMSIGRFNIISAMHELGVINTEKPHHLLGTGLAREAEFYVRHNMTFIRSIDTSSPIMYAIKGYKYNSSTGNDCKFPDKICDIIDSDVTACLNDAIHNMKLFDTFCGGTQWQ